jgi:hypothetical protein
MDRQTQQRVEAIWRLAVLCAAGVVLERRQGGRRSDMADLSV